MTALASRLTAVVYSPADRLYCGLKTFVLMSAILAPVLMAMKFVWPGSVPFLVPAIFLGGSALVGAGFAAYTTLLMERGVIRACFAIKNGAAQTHVDYADRVLVIGRTDRRISRYVTFEEHYQELLRVPLDRVEAWNEALANSYLLLGHDRPPRPVFGAEAETTPRGDLIE